MGLVQIIKGFRDQRKQAIFIFHKAIESLGLETNLPDLNT